MTAEDDEASFWWLNDEGSLGFQTAELEALAVCFPLINLDVELTLATFVAVGWKFVTDRCEANGKVTAADRKSINATLNLWRQHIELLQSKVDALPIQET
jgi:hypothetical protein